MLPRLLLLLCLIPLLASAEPRHETYLCIYGGTSAGVVAAVQAAKMGKRVILAEPGQHLGGMIWWPADLHHARRVVKDGRVWNEGAVFQEAKEPDWIPSGIPYRCLLPKRSEVTNLLSPTCPSSSYVAYGAYRIEFTFMVAAQSAATAAVMAIDAGLPLGEISYPALRERLPADGQVLSIFK